MKKLVNHFNAITKNAKNTEARPFLSQVNFNSETQMIECTDSHRLLQVKSKQPIEHTYNLNLTTLETINNVSYPDLSKFIVENGISVFEMFLATLTKEQLKILKIYKKERIHLSIENNNLIFKAEDTQITLFTLQININKTPDGFDMYFNPLYLFDCFNFLLETQKDKVVVYYNGNTKPLQFSNENEFNYSIAPFFKLD